MNDNTVVLLSSINNNLAIIVRYLSPQNKGEREKTAQFNQGGLNANNIKADTKTDTDFSSDGIKNLASSLTGLPESVKNVARLQGRTMRNFKAVMMDLAELMQEMQKDINSKQTGAAANMISTLSNLKSLPEVMKDMGKLKEKNVDVFVNCVGKLFDKLADSISKSKASKDDVEKAKTMTEILSKLSGAMKDLSKMVIIAPLAMLGLAAITPVLLLFAGVVALIGKIGPSVRRGSIALMQMTKFMKDLMKVAFLGVVLTGALFALGTLAKTQFPTIMAGLGAMAAVLLGVAVMGALIGLVGKVAMANTEYMKEVIKLSLFGIVLTGAMAGLGLLMQNGGFVLAMTGLGATAAILFTMTGIIALCVAVGGLVKLSESTGVLLDVLKIAFFSIGLAAMTTLLGTYIKDHWQDALFGLGATAVILTEIWGLAKLADRIGEGAKKGAQAMLLCEGVIAGALVLVLGTIGVAKVIENYFGNGNWERATLGVTATFALSTLILVETVKLCKAADKMSTAAKNGALALLLCEGVIAASNIVLLAILGTAKKLEKEGYMTLEGLGKISIIFGLMTGIVTGAALLAKLVSTMTAAPSFKKGILAMALIELLMVGSLGIVLATSRVYKEVSQNGGFKGIITTVGEMALMIGAFTGLAEVLGLLAVPPMGFLLAAGIGVIGLIELCIGGMILVTRRLNDLKKSMDEAGNTPKSLSETLKGITHDILSWDTLTPSIGPVKAAALTVMYASLLPVFAAIDMITVTVSNMARRFGGVTNGKRGDIAPYYGMNGNTPVFGEPVNIIETSEIIVDAITTFAKNLETGFKEINNISDIICAGDVIRRITKPVDMFTKMLLGFSENKDGELSAITIDEKGNTHKLGPVNVVNVAKQISGAISAFVTELFKTGSETWIKNMTAHRNLAGESRAERAMGVLGKIIDPVNKFTEAMLSFKTDGENLKSIKFDEKGNPIDGPSVNIQTVAGSISGAIDKFVDTLFGPEATWYEHFKKNFWTGTSDSDALGVLATVLTPVSNFVDVISALNTKNGGRLSKVMIDGNGNIKEFPVNIVLVAENIANAIKTFAETLFSTQNQEIWKNIIYKTNASQTETDSQKAMGVLSIILEPVCKFVDTISKFTVSGDVLSVPVFDKDGKITSYRESDITGVARTLANAVTTFARILFVDNKKQWEDMLGEDGGEGTNKKMGVLGMIVSPVVSFVETVSRFGYEEGKMFVYDGEKKHEVDIAEIAKGMAQGISTFVSGIKDSIGDMTTLTEDETKKVSDFCVTMGTLFENFAKLGDIDTVKLKQVDVVINTFFGSYDNIYEKLMDREKRRIEEGDIITLDSLFSAVKDIIVRFDDYDETKSKAKVSLDIMDDMVTHMSVIMAKVSAIPPTVSMDPVNSYITSLKDITGYLNDNDSFLSRFTLSQQNLPPCLIISAMTESIERIAKSDAPTVESVKKSYLAMLSGVIAESTSDKRGNLDKMSKSMNAMTKSISGFDNALKKEHKTRKKNIEEITSLVNELNEKLEKTADKLGGITDKLDNMVRHKDDYEGIVNAVGSANAPKRTNAASGLANILNGGNRNGGEEVQVASGLSVNEVQTAIEIGVRNALDGIRLDSNFMAAGSAGSAYAAADSLSSVAEEIRGLVSALTQIDFTISAK